MSGTVCGVFRCRWFGLVLGRSLSVSLARIGPVADGVSGSSLVGVIGATVNRCRASVSTGWSGLAPIVGVRAAAGIAWPGLVAMLMIGADVFAPGPPGSDRLTIPPVIKA